MANLHCRLKFDLGENEIHRKEERVKDSKIAKFLLKSVVKYEKYSFAKFANFIHEFRKLYFLYSKTFRNQTWQFYQFYDVLSRCGDGFRLSCIYQNFVNNTN